jgi:general secretion pathway protein A
MRGTSQQPMSTAVIRSRFGLEIDPFLAEPAADFFYPSLGHRDCLERVRDAVRMGGGLVVVTGDPGIGKSTLLRSLKDELTAEDELTLITIDNPAQTRTDVQLLRALLAALDIEPRGRTGLDLSAEFNQQVAELALRGRPVRLLIDDAHHLAGSQLEVLRALLSFSPTTEALGMTLFGEPSLLDKIDRKRNLASRVIARHALNPVNRRDLDSMVRHRLQAAGRPVNAPALFSQEAVAVLYQRSGGVPGTAVGLAQSCLQTAALLGREQVDASIAHSVERGQASGQMQARLPLQLDDMTGVNGA